MLKVLGKIKKDKSKKEKSERQDDGQSNLKNNKAMVIKEKEKEREKEPGKEKEKQRSRKKRKGRGVSSLGDLSQSSGEPSSRGNSPPSLEGPYDGHHHHHKKGSKHISKSCEAAVNQAVKEFFECAWRAMSERFFLTSAPITVSYELRNTWLRIVEAEWQDPDMREKPSTKPNRIFKRDEPPLPLALDSWARGALEPVPGHKRESVMDPFLRDISYYGEIPDPKRFTTMLSSDIDHDFGDSVISPENETHEDAGESEEEDVEYTSAKDTTTTENKRSPSDQDIPEGDVWNFDLDKNISQHDFPRESDTNSVPRSLPTSDYKLSQDSQLSNGSQFGRTFIQTLLPIRPAVLSYQSTTDGDSSSPPSGGRTVRRNAPLKQRFSPSQCGGRVGTGIFRLPLETTSEALLRNKASQNSARKEGSQIEEQTAGDHVEIVQLSKKSDSKQKSIEEEGELEVLPLFEERTSRAVVEDTHHSFPGDIWRRPSYNEVHGKGLSLDQVASEINKRFLRRRIVNLQGSFKRQTIRSLVARTRAKQLESMSLMTRRMTSSSMVSRSSSNKTNPTRSKTDKRWSNVTGRTSRSVSNMNVARGESTIFLTRRSQAKCAASDPNLDNSRQEIGRGYGSMKFGTGQGGHQQQNKLSFNIPNKNNNFKKMANVRESQKGGCRNSLAEQFRDANRVLERNRFENSRKFYRSGNQGRTMSTCQSLESVPSDCHCRTRTTYCVNCCPP